ncbi:hypothetical protein ACVNP1_02345 [Staphylococcus aureus]
MNKHGKVASLINEIQVGIEKITSAYHTGLVLRESSNPDVVVCQNI